MPRISPPFPRAIIARKIQRIIVDLPILPLDYSVIAIVYRAGVALRENGD